MMLAINTAQKVHELALIETSKPSEWELLGEKRWEDARRDVEDLAPFLAELLEKLGVSKSEIQEIMVVRGPGSFTSLRTGVAFANALAEGLQAKLYSLDTFELLRRKVASVDPVLALLEAGGLNIAVRYNDEPVRVGPLASLLKDYPHDHDIHVVYELNETQEEELRPVLREKNWKPVLGHELQSFGEMILTYQLKGLQSVEIVEPYYLKAPHITKSSDPWKR